LNGTDVEIEEPVYFSAETNWRPTKLDRLEDFIMRIDSATPTDFNLPLHNLTPQQKK
jgi:hypothetical protein